MTDKVGQWEDVPANVGEWETVAPAPKTRKVGMPDFSERTKIPEEAGKRNRALMLGLGTSLVTPIGQFEQMVTPEVEGPLKGQETVFTTPKQLREGLQKSGIVSKLSPEEEKYAGYGELVPAVALGGKALKQGLGLAADYLGNTSLGKTLSKGYQNVTGKTAAKAAQEAEALGAKVKSQTEASVSERAAAERTAEKEAAARAKELGSSKNRELQSQADITQAKGAVSQKLIADKTKATKATENALKNLSNKATTDSCNKGEDEGFHFPYTERHEHHQNKDVKGCDYCTPEQGDPEQNIKSDSRAENFGKIARGNSAFANYPQDITYSF